MISNDDIKNATNKLIDLVKELERKYPNHPLLSSVKQFLKRLLEHCRLINKGIKDYDQNECLMNEILSWINKIRQALSN